MSMVTRLIGRFRTVPKPGPPVLAVIPDRPQSYVVEPEIRLERSNARGQIAELWTDIVQRRIPMAYPRALRTLCLETIEAMPGLSFASPNDRARTWAMVGSLYFKTLHPDWLGGFEGTEPCAVAERCYREADRADPDPWWQDWIARFSDSEGGASGAAALDAAPARDAASADQVSPGHSEDGLIAACLTGDVARVEHHLGEDGPFERDALNEGLRYGTRLGAAKHAESVAIARLLLEAGADVDHSDDSGETALLHAVRHDNLELVKCLLAAGADPKRHDGFHQTAESVAWTCASEVEKSIHREIVAEIARRKRKARQAGSAEQGPRL